MQLISQIKFISTGNITDCIKDFCKIYNKKIQRYAYIKTMSKNSQVNKQASAERPVSSVLGRYR